MRKLSFIVPGRLATRTGGYRYDERIIGALRGLGWQVSIHELPGSYPTPDAAARDAAGAILSDLPNGRLVVVDGLAFGALPDLAHAHGQRLKLIALVHHPLALETGLDAQASAKLEQSERDALQATWGVIVTSAATARLLQNYGVAPQAVQVVEPGTDKPLAAARHRSAKADRKPAVSMLCVASVTPRKGHAMLFEALAPWRGADWTLQCVGNTEKDPALVQRLLQQISELGLDERVTLTGELDDHALRQCYRRANALVLASHFEGYGMVFDEAAAHGLPVISTRVGAVESALAATGCSLVDPGDVSGLSRALGRFIAEPAWREQLTRSARGAASQRKDWHQAGLAFDRALGALAP